MKKTIGRLVGVALLAACSITAHANDWQTEVDLSRADLSKFTLNLINNGEKAGRMVYGWRREGDTYVIEDLTEMKPNILETAKAVIDASTYSPRSIDIDFAVGGSKMVIDLDWSGTQSTGTYTTTREDQSPHVTDVNLATDAPLRLSIFGLIAGLPLRDGYELALPWHNVMGNKLEDIQLITLGSEAVDTPAGTFETFKVAIKGGSPENIVYVSKQLPRKIVRIEVVGQPMHFELAR